MAISDYLRKLVELKNQFVANLKSMGVTADDSEKLNTLVPKVLECKGEQNVEFVEGANFAGSNSSPGVSYAISKITLPDGTTTIGDYAFYKCTNLTSIIIPGGVTSIGVYAFSGCTSLANITIPDSVTSIGSYAFSKCENIKKIIVADGSKTITEVMIDPFALYCKEIIIPDSVTSIGDRAFDQFHYLTNITFGSGVTSIGSSAFSGCTSLANITIPDSVTSIGNAIFAECTNLAHIYYTGTQTQWDAITKGTNWNYNMGSNVTGGTVIHYNYTG